MKSFTTRQMTDQGKILLPMQLEGMSRNTAGGLLLNQAITELGIPVSHTPGKTWFARVTLGCGSTVDITASSTEVESWHEYGTLNAEFLPTVASPNVALSRYPISAFIIDRVDVLVAEDASYQVEAGLIFTAIDGRELAFVAGDIPGAFSVKLPEGAGELHPQLDWESHHRYPFTQL